MHTRHDFEPYNSQITPFLSHKNLNTFLFPLFETMLIKLNSLNINGFNKSTDKLAQFINQHNIHITFIQETHTIQQQQLSHFAHQYNFLVYPNTDHSLTPQISHRQGTLTIINSNHLHLKPQMISSDIILPNYIQLLSFTLSDMNYTLINCYLPSGNSSPQTSHRTKAIKTLTSYLQKLDYKNNKVIIAGDFNLVTNPIDRTGHFTPNTIDKILFQKLLSSFDLIDSYRNLYPYSKTFSFSRSHPTSRLDRIYISSSLTPKITQSSYCNITFSDHNKSPTLTLKIPSKINFKSSHWKLNNSILAIPLIHLYIKSFIKNLSEPLNPIQQPLNWWDLIKLKIKQRLILYSKSQHNKNEKHQTILQNKLNRAKQLGKHKEIYNTTHQLEELQQNKQIGSQIRSRLPPMTSIDNPSPLASIVENLTQSKSLLPSDLNSSYPTSNAENKSNKFSPTYLSLKTCGTLQLLLLIPSIILMKFPPQSLMMSYNSSPLPP